MMMMMTIILIIINNVDDDDDDVIYRLGHSFPFSAKVFSRPKGAI